MFDAVHVVVSAVRELNRSQEIGVKPLACTSANIWQHGTSLMNYLRMVRHGCTFRVAPQPFTQDEACPNLAISKRKVLLAPNVGLNWSKRGIATRTPGRNFGRMPSLWNVAFLPVSKLQTSYSLVVHSGATLGLLCHLICHLYVCVFPAHLYRLCIFGLLADGAYPCLSVLLFTKICPLCTLCPIGLTSSVWR